MSIPSFQGIMRPALERLGDGQVHAFSDFVDAMSDHFNLTTDERSELISSGRQPRMTNRTAWTLTHLTKAGMVVRPSRGQLQITAQGIALLSAHKEDIDTRLLSKLSESYRAFRSGNSKSLSGGDSAGQSEKLDVAEEATPHELIETSYVRVQALLADELLERIRTMTPAFFERLVVEVLVAMGYGGSRQDAGRAVGGTGDGGIDGLINEDPLGLDVIYIQAKRWTDTVGRPTVQGFAGSLDGYRARKGVFITTSRFSDDALQYVRQIEKRIVLMDGQRLAQYMIEHGVGVSDVATYRVRKLDEDYFSGT